MYTNQFRNFKFKKILKKNNTLLLITIKQKNYRIIKIKLTH